VAGNVTAGMVESNIETHQFTSGFMTKFYALVFYYYYYCCCCCF